MNGAMATVLAIPAAIGLWWLVITNPKTKRQWMIAGSIFAYVAVIWFFVIRKMH
jgi:hypothetical protein